MEFGLDNVYYASIFITCLCLLLCVGITYFSFKRNYFKILPILSCIIIFWNNIVLSVITLIYTKYIRLKLHYLYTCACFSMLIHFPLILNTQIMLFLIYERYAKICCSPQFYKDKIKNIKLIYGIMLINSIIISILILNFQRIFNHSNLKSCETCCIFHWMGIFNGIPILILIQILFYAFSSYCIIKMYRHIKKYPNPQSKVDIDNATFNLFRSSEFINNKCVQSFYLVCAITFSFVSIQTPILLSIWIGMIFLYLKNQECVKQNFYLIISFSLHLYFVIIQIVFLLFSNFIQQKSQKK